MPEGYGGKARVIVDGIVQQIKPLSVVSEEQVRGGVVRGDLERYARLGEIW